MKIFIGLDVKNRISFDKQYIISANHNSHLDALAIISLFPDKHTTDKRDSFQNYFDFENN